MPIGHAHRSNSPHYAREQDCSDHRCRSNRAPFLKSLRVCARRGRFDYFVLGLLEVADETRHHLLCIKAEEIRIPSKKWKQVKLIGNRVVAIALDHPDV